MVNWKIHSASSVQNDYAFEEIYQKYSDILNSPETGFFHLPSNKDLIQSAKSTYNKFKNKKFFVHIGIGGSALGPDMLLKALPAKSDVKFIFLNNIDPDDLHHQLNKVDLKDALVYVVSKSGTTAETVAAMSIVCSELEKIGVTKEKFKDYFVFCTDPVSGDLRKISKDWNVDCLEVPSNIGGRFSVLSSVGLLPMLFAGIDAQKVLDGAKEISAKLSDKNQIRPFFDIGGWLYSLHNQGINQTVLMPYSSLLKEFSAWFVQLWAESLGKDGKGLTPIPGYGATDQHSQMQLFMEGPNDKAIFLIEVQKFAKDYSLKNAIPGTSFELLSNFSLSELMKAEFEGTLKALTENKRNILHMQLPEVNEESLGQLVLFSECLTVLLGIFLKVNPFNQPGVEAGKKYAHVWLKSQR